MSEGRAVIGIVVVAPIVIAFLVFAFTYGGGATKEAPSPLRHVAGTSYDGLMVFHDDERHVTCYAMHNNGIWCVMDSTLEREEEIQTTSAAAAIRAHADGGTK